MSLFHFTPPEIIGMLLALGVLVSLSVWAQRLRKRQYDFIGHRNIFFIVSGVLIVVSIASLTFKGLNKGLDFTGGSILELNFIQAPRSEDIRSILATVNPDNAGDAVIQVANQVTGADGKLVVPVLIRSRELGPEQVTTILADLKARYGSVELSRQESIGPVIGAELRNKAVLALVIALLIQLIYITIRFGSQMRYGLAADLALAHDLVIMVGIYSLVGRQVDSPFVAALLTVVGYSVMDSIVIFDRIRENQKVLERGSFANSVNVSVNQTMTRSINTLLTVLITLFALYFFGGSTLRNFAFALLVGVTSGAYSSVFIASPLLVMLDDWVNQRERKRVEVRRAVLAQKAQLREQEIMVRRRRKPTGPELQKTAPESEEGMGEPDEEVAATAAADRKFSARRRPPTGRRRRR